MGVRMEAADDDLVVAEGQQARAGDEVVRKKLEAAVHYTVGKIAQEFGEAHGMEASQQFVQALASVVFDQAESMVSDMSLFAKHGKRQVINADDVKLLARRNESLLQHLSEFENEVKGTKKAGGRRSAQKRM